MHSIGKSIAVAGLAAGFLFSTTAAFAQAGGPDLPGGAKTTTKSGKATAKPRSHMKMSKGKGKMHKA